MASSQSGQPARDVVHLPAHMPKRASNSSGSLQAAVIKFCKHLEEGNLLVSASMHAATHESRHARAKAEGQGKKPWPLPAMQFLRYRNGDTVFPTLAQPLFGEGQLSRHEQSGTGLLSGKYAFNTAMVTSGAYIQKIIM